MTDPVCFLARFTDTRCNGRLVRAHLIPRQLLKREGHEALIPDSRTWVWACGGLVGSTGHHGQLDYSRTLRIPRAALPAAVEAVAAEMGLTWWLEREYGQREDAAA